MTAPAPQESTPRIFVSHAHADNLFCREYVAGLRAHGCYVWYDEHSLGWGALRPTIERELPTCQHFVAILTPASVASEWVNSEIDAALELLKDGTLHTLTFIVAERCIVPLLLRRWKRIEGADGAPVGMGEAVERTLHIMGLAKVAAPPPKSAPASPTPEPASSPFSPTRIIAPRVEQLGFIAQARRRDGKWVELILPPLCDVPAGPFRMGSNRKQDPHSLSDEHSHEVKLGAFQIARYPVTVAEYACYVRDGHAAPLQSTFEPVTWVWEDQIKHPDHPVVNVSWHDAMAYAAWLAHLTGQPWRLPTEAEWEKAARYDPATRVNRVYPWGDAFDSKDRANTSASGRKGTAPLYSYPVGASPCGAQDMVGNVWEWTSSTYKPYPYDSGDGRERGDASVARVMRGGSWHSTPQAARVAHRGHNTPRWASGDVGFRLVLAALGS